MFWLLAILPLASANRIVTIEQPPFVYIDRSGYLKGFLMDVLQGLNISGTIHLIPDGSYGTPTPNGGWNGIMGELINDKADLALAPMIISPIRKSVIDFSVPFMVENLALIANSKAEEVETLLDGESHFGTVLGSFANAYFNNYRGKSSLMQRIAARMQSTPEQAQPSSMPDAIRKLNRGGFILGTTTTAAQLIAKQEGCRYTTYALRDYSAPLALGVRKGSILKKQVDNAMLKMIIRKELTEITRKWFGGSCE